MSDSSSKADLSSAGGLDQLRRRVWWHRHLDPEDRRRVMDDLAMRRGDRKIFPFVVMLTLSVVVAVMGLALNSAAVVIGAMLIAPLMQPVLATGACLSLALYRKSLFAFVRVVMATVWCIAIGFFLSKVLPEQELTPEVLARTQPDIKDLVVALAAGTAGAYATVREDASSGLPGVAVAVALVPPLAAVGATLEAGQNTLAWGAFLLYTTNLSAIIFASISVFVFTGFVPPRRIASTIKGVSIAKLGLAALVAIVAFPLYQASRSSVEATEQQLSVKAEVAAWLGEVDLQSQVNVGDDKIVVALQGFERPPPQELLEENLAVLFPEAEVLVEWVRTEQITTTTTAPPDPDAELESEVLPVVIEWLDSGGADYEIEEVSVEGDVVRIDVDGAGEPPSIDDLDSLLDEQIDETLTPRLNWTQRETIRPGDNDPTPIDQIQDQMMRFVDTWADEQDVQLREFIYDGELVEAEFAGARSPSQTALAELNEALVEFHGDETLPIEFYFLQRQPLSAP